MLQLADELTEQVEEWKGKAEVFINRIPSDSLSCGCFSRLGAITESLDRGPEELKMTEENTKWQEEMNRERE